MSALQSRPVILPVVYIAGKYRAATPWQVLGNVRAAQEAALRVWKMGAVALCPHSNSALFDGEADDSVWLEGDKELLRRCDAVLMVGDWQRSSGACAEHALAADLGLPIFYDGAESVLRAWLDDWKRRAQEAQ
jgi:hypothetical protein